MMSGTYSIDGVQLDVMPGIKSWRFPRGRTGGNGIGQTPAFWAVDWTFPVMDSSTGSTLAFLADKYNESGLHSVVMSHPATGYLTVFSGVAITSFGFEYTDVEDDGYVQNVKMQLGHISESLAFRIDRQPYWWFGNERDYVVSVSGYVDGVCQTATITLSIQNNDTRSLAETIVSVATPPGLSYSSAFGDGVFDDAAGKWTLSGVAGGSTVSIFITYDVVTVDNYDFTAVVDAAPYTNVDPANDTASVTISPWWLTAGLTTADVNGAYVPIYAADLTDSLTNRNAPGVNDLIIGVAPTFVEEVGWSFTGSEYLIHPSNATQEMTVIVLVSFTAGSPAVNNIVGTAESTESTALLKIDYNVGVERLTYRLSHYTHTDEDIDFENAVSGSYKQVILGFSALPLVDEGGGSYIKPIHGLVGSSPKIIGSDTITSSGFFVTGTVGFGIGAILTTTTPASFFQGNIIAFAYYNTALSDEQLTDIGTALTENFG